MACDHYVRATSAGVQCLRCGDAWRPSLCSRIVTRIVMLLWRWMP